MIAEVQAEFKIFGAIVQKLELLGRPDGGIPANRVAAFLQIGQKNARGVPSPRIWRVCSFRRRRSLPVPLWLCAATRFFAGRVRPIRKRTPRLCAALRSPQGRSPHPQTDVAALRCAALPGRGGHPIRKRTLRLCAACSRRARSPHPRWMLRLCTTKRAPAGRVHPIRDGCRGFALRAPPARETFPRALFSPPRRRGRCCSQNRAIAARPRPWRCGP